ncbi:MAG TPA: cation:proton antiporter regulatory subunit [Acidimicrobiia bacterium]|nr:cation:proton antiporter regulatory subunit [Acidimicrobiia bacterium]
MADVSETLLPGVGVRHEFVTASGERLAVLTHRTGRRELAIYDRSDPDRCTTVLHLSHDDTRTLAELLGASPVSEAVSAVQQRLEGLAIDWITIPAGSPVVGATIAEGAFRTRTGVSIVAVVREATTLPAPGPDHRFEAGDVAVAVGTTDGLAQLRNLLVP